MISKALEKALVEQIEVESYSSSVYLSMASWMALKGYQGTAEFLFRQSDEERMHMIKILRYLSDAGGNATVPAIKKPPHDFKSFSNCFQQILEQEQGVTKSIHQLVDLALKEKDHGTYHFLQWYVAEQIEEENQVKMILDKIKIIGNDGSGMYLLDRDLGKMISAADAGAQPA